MEREQTVNGLKNRVFKRSWLQFVSAIHGDDKRERNICGCERHLSQRSPAAWHVMDGAIDWHWLQEDKKKFHLTNLEVW